MERQMRRKEHSHKNATMVTVAAIMTTGLQAPLCVPTNAIAHAVHIARRNSVPMRVNIQRCVQRSA